MRWLIALCVLACCKRVHSTGADAPAADIGDAADPVSPDFVVNSTLFGNQFLSDDIEANGLQLATADGAVWTVVFRDECTYCMIRGRRFDDAGSPYPSDWSQGTDQFVLSPDATTPDAIPAVAAAFDRTLVFWDFTDFETSERGIACTALNTRAEPVGARQPPIALEPADVVTAAALGFGNFVVTWQTKSTEQTIRSAIVEPDCSILTGPVTLSSYSGTTGARRSHVASNGSYLLYAWIVDGDLHVRTGGDDGSLGSERVLLYKTTTEQIDFVRVVPWGTDFALAVRIGLRIELYRVNVSGQITSAPFVAGLRAAAESFGVAQRFDGTLLVVWHTCPTGPGSCDVYGRYLRTDGSVLGPEFVVPTTTAGDQARPSVIALADSFVVAWTDGSAAKPDDSGSAVRARIIRPAL